MVNVHTTQNKDRANTRSFYQPMCDRNNLGRKFACGCEDQGRRPMSRWLTNQAFNNGNDKSTCFSSTGLCTSPNIMTFKCFRNGLCLNGSGFSITELSDGLKK